MIFVTLRVVVYLSLRMCTQYEQEHGAGHMNRIHPTVEIPL
jgi:hypothetical protein